MVTALGDGVVEFAVGDEVLGFSWERSSHATHASVPIGQLIHKPPELSWEVAGSLYVVGCTAFAAVRAVDVQEGETVAVSAAAGGVGTVVVQLSGHPACHGSSVSPQPSNADWLASHGAVQVSYGDGLADRLRAAAPDGIDAFIDLFGPEYVQLAADLGIAPDRIETIISFDKAAELGTKADGSGTASTPEVLTEMAGLVAIGRHRDPHRRHLSAGPGGRRLPSARTAPHPGQDRPHPLNRRGGDQVGGSKTTAVAISVGSGATRGSRT